MLAERIYIYLEYSCSYPIEGDYRANDGYQLTTIAMITTIRNITVHEPGSQNTYHPGHSLYHGLGGVYVQQWTVTGR